MLPSARASSPVWPETKTVMSNSSDISDFLELFDVPSAARCGFLSLMTARPAILPWCGARAPPSLWCGGVAKSAGAPSIRRMPVRALVAPHGTLC
jgi:hypothetical protein